MPSRADMKEALKTEFGGDILFVAAVPSTFSPPQVIVMPGDNWLEPDTHGTVVERWEVWVIVSIKEPEAGIDQAALLNLRIQQACYSVGAHWELVRQPRVPRNQQGQMVAARNLIRFKYTA
jgi:hypothetical protein